MLARAALQVRGAPAPRLPAPRRAPAGCWGRGERRRRAGGGLLCGRGACVCWGPPRSAPKPPRVQPTEAPGPSCAPPPDVRRSAAAGTLQVYDLAADGGNALCEIPAHKAPLAAVAWSADGALLATASTTGTVVRVHALQPGASRLFSFRRGSTHATVHCLAFSPPGVEPRLLAAASSHGTVHLFRLGAGERHPAMAAASAAAGLLSSVIKLPVADIVRFRAAGGRASRPTPARGLQARRPFV
jgi:hypothetical protein